MKDKNVAKGRLFMTLQVVGREVAVIALLVPLLDPRDGAHRLVGAEELLAGRELLALGLDAPEVVDVVLEAAVSLVLVRETRVVAVSVQLAAEIVAHFWCIFYVGGSGRGLANGILRYTTNHNHHPPAYGREGVRDCRTSRPPSGFDTPQREEIGDWWMSTY